jgi:hypothetical protein
LRFGRFLNFPTTVENPETGPLGLTERRFREFWDRTDKCGGNERRVSSGAAGVRRESWWHMHCAIG